MCFMAHAHATYKHHKHPHHHTYPKKFKNRVYGWYPVLIIIFACVKLFESVLVINPAQWETVATYFIHLSMAWLVFNLLLFIRFLTGNFEIVSFVMPIYYIIDYLISILFGFLLVTVYGVNTLAGQTWFIILTAVFVAWEIGFALYLIFRRL